MKIQACVVCTFALAACAPPPVPAFDAAAQAHVRDSVTATLRAYEAAIKTLDSAKIVAFYADDPAFRIVEGQRVEERKEVLALVGSIRASLRSLDGGFVYDSLVIRPSWYVQGAATLNVSRKVPSDSGTGTVRHRRRAT